MQNKGKPRKTNPARQLLFKPSERGRGHCFGVPKDLRQINCQLYTINCDQISSIFIGIIYALKLVPYDESVVTVQTPSYVPRSAGFFVPFAVSTV